MVGQRRYGYRDRYEDIEINLCIIHKHWINYFQRVLNIFYILTDF